MLSIHVFSGRHQRVSLPTTTTTNGVLHRIQRMYVGVFRNVTIALNAA